MTSVKQDIGGALFFLVILALVLFLNHDACWQLEKTRNYLDLVAFKATDSESHANYSVRTHLRDLDAPFRKEMYCKENEPSPKTGCKMYVLLSQLSISANSQMVATKLILPPSLLPLWWGKC